MLSYHQLGSYQHLIAFGRGRVRFFFLFVLFQFLNHETSGRLDTNQSSPKSQDASNQALWENTNKQTRRNLKVKWEGVGKIEKSSQGLSVMAHAFIPNTLEEEVVDLSEFESTLQNEFQDSQSGYTDKPCLDCPPHSKKKKCWLGQVCWGVNMFKMYYIKIPKVY